MTRQPVRAGGVVGRPLGPVRPLAFPCPVQGTNAPGVEDLAVNIDE